MGSMAFHGGPALDALPPSSLSIRDALDDCRVKDGLPRGGASDGLGGRGGGVLFTVAGVLGSGRVTVSGC